MSARTYPHIRVSGDARERGRQYGEAARARVARSLDLYAEVFATDAGLSWSAACELAGAFAAPIAEYAPKYLEEMEGIAEGASVTLADVLALNVRSEVKTAALARAAASRPASAPRECTTLAVRPAGTADGHTLVAQNWDWYDACEDTVVVLEADQPDAPNFVTVVEAGLLAKTGMNAAGVGLVTNLLASCEDRSAPGVPFHVSLRAVLDAADPVDALARLQAPVRSASASYVVGGPGGLVFAAEGIPGDFSEIHLLWPGEATFLAHTNHFVSPTLRHKDVGRRSIPCSPFRLQRVTELLAELPGAATPEALQDVLRDHFPDRTVSVCAHPADTADRLLRSMTVASVVMDVDARRMWLSDGPPCQHEYRELDYSGFLCA